MIRNITTGKVNWPLFHKEQHRFTLFAYRVKLGLITVVGNVKYQEQT